MKTKSKFFGFSAKLAFAVLAVGTMLASCYEKGEIDAKPNPNPVPPKYMIVGNVTSLNTGKALPATVTIDGTTVKVNANGYFEKTGLTPGAHVVKAVIDKYFDAMKTVYLPEAATGGTCVVSADFALADATSVIIKPDKEVAPATEAQAKEMVKNNSKAIIDAFKAAGIDGVTADNFVLDPSTGKVTLKVLPKTKAAVGEAVTVKLPYFSGFASSITPESDNIFTRATTEGQTWLASASKVLGRVYGLTVENKEVKFAGVVGKAITAYTLTVLFKNDVYVFSGAEGVVMYQEFWKAEPVYDSHDSHNGHGSNPGAGGGSGR